MSLHICIDCLAMTRVKDLDGIDPDSDPTIEEKRIYIRLFEEQTGSRFDLISPNKLYHIKIVILILYHDFGQEKGWI